MTKKNTLVARHFYTKGHTVDDLMCTAIELNRRGDDASRKEREKFWRHKLRTNFPDGLNAWDGDNGLVGPGHLKLQDWSRPRRQK